MFLPLLADGVISGAFSDDSRSLLESLNFQRAGRVDFRSINRRVHTSTASRSARATIQRTQRTKGFSANESRRARAEKRSRMD